MPAPTTHRRLDRRPRQHSRRRRTTERSTTTTARVTVGVLILVTGLFAFTGSAGAQEDDGDGGDGGDGVDPEAAEVETEVRGTLIGQDEEGDDVPLAEVEFIVTDEEGVEVGRGSSNDEGAWNVLLPEGGTYSVLLDESTLPDGVELRNPDNNPLTITLSTGDSRPGLFPIGDAPVSDTSTIQAVQLFVDGLKFGLIIAMCAVGLSLIYGTTRLVNFAHAEMVTWGAMVAFVFHVTGVFGWQAPLLFGALMAFVVCGASGGLFNQVVWKPLRNRGASLVAMLVISIGFSIFFRYLTLYFFGGRARFYSDFRIQQKWDFGWFTIAPKDAFIIVFSTTTLLLVALGLQKTRAGKAMRAVADNRELAESSGIDVERVIRWVWIAGSALAGLGGVLSGTTEAVSWDMGFRILLLMFAGMTLGGLGTAYGALFGSIIVGVFIQMSTLVIPTDMKNVGALLVLIVVLMIRPQGLFGRAERIG